MTTRADRLAAARLAWAAIKLTKAGRHPVGVGRLAATVGMPPAEASRLLALAGFGVRGELVAVDRALRARREAGRDRGCSTDLFLLAIATGERVHAESRCPATGARIRVELSPDAVLLVDPPSAVVAVIDGDFGPDLLDTLCAEQPFFASPVAAQDWLAANPGGRVHPVPVFLAEAHRMAAALDASLVARI